LLILVLIMVLKLSLARQINSGSEAGTEQGWRKNRKNQNTGWSGDSIDPARPDQKPGCNPLIFLLKRRRFDFLKQNQNDLSDSATLLKPETLALDRAGFKNSGSNTFKIYYFFNFIPKYLISFNFFNPIWLSFFSAIFFYHFLDLFFFQFYSLTFYLILYPILVLIFLFLFFYPFLHLF